jgi:hypothetical protein
MVYVMTDRISCTANRAKYFKGRRVYLIPEKLKITNRICEPQVCTIDRYLSFLQS